MAACTMRTHAHIQVKRLIFRKKTFQRELNETTCNVFATLIHHTSQRHCEPPTPLRERNYLQCVCNADPPHQPTSLRATNPTTYVVRRDYFGSERFGCLCCFRNTHGVRQVHAEKGIVEWLGKSEVCFHLGDERGVCVVMMSHRNRQPHVSIKWQWQLAASSRGH